MKHLSNIPLQQGVFPEKLKIACVTLIFKNGDISLLANYRTISVLSCFPKLLERIMYSRLYRFVTKSEILY